MGWSIAERLIAEGASVIATGTKPNGTVPPGCEYLEVRLEDMASTEAACAVIRDRKPNILISNAGVSSPATAEELDMDDVIRLHQINFLSPFMLCQAAIPGMQEHRFGRIVNITAGSGVYGRKGRQSYGASKAALEAMTACIAVEHAESGILANCVAPGFILTDVLRDIFPTEEALEQLSDQVPMKRLGRPSDVASIVSWLASSRNSYMTAENLFIDGAYARTRQP
jgi:3-oxoacyl-[acyl-carrier protein] reductase